MPYENLLSTIKKIGICPITGFFQMFLLTLWTIYNIINTLLTLEDLYVDPLKILRRFIGEKYGILQY